MYSNIETAIVQAILAHFDSELNGDQSLCAAGDVDSLLTQMANTNATYGVLLEFGGGSLNRNNPFNKDVWSWQVIGVMLVRYFTSQQVETDLRSIVDKVSTLFSDDHRVGNVAALVRVTRITTPEPTQINDIPYYWVGFDIVAYEKF
jgi:hypothetical protein